jgi:hypothetical protein
MLSTKSSNEMLANGFTKAFDHTKFNTFVSSIDLRSLSLT